ncbi:hypothetical protein GPECTOR_30g164 [Gonium pectorale]|uniref:Uncharacterized protein n=1 Tax=Gonium pectorale TaxID=33097 RepID=A0A150GE05_GONPE|nr:hypothetical protein GPECTOR_30g164 [Gonium pectorale]|eukprot:KXZ48069.1 hypothetical protein GPECTOR_30g164 [Gonium pectorale]
MPTGIEDTIWVNIGSAAALVGATVGATFVGALAIARGIDNAEDLVDPDLRAQQNGLDAQAEAQPAQRTRLRAEDVLAAQEPQEQKPAEGAKK